MKELLIISFLMALGGSAGESIAHNAQQLNINQKNNYRKIKIDEVLANVLKAISDNYIGYTVIEAYISEEETGEYKLVLKKEGKQLVVYYKSSGELIKQDVK